ncbi:MAG: hypothetical protein QW802_03960 [Candidatus Altiarchaeota archaeon]
MKMRNLYYLIMISVFFNFFVVNVFAIPKLINLEGKLTNSEGIPLYGNFNMTFTIYNSPTGGNPLWKEEHSGVNNITTSNTGIFSVLLGSINPLDLNFTEDYWLEIQVKDEVLSPRQRVASSGYTYMTSRLECSSKFCINYSNGNVGIGTTTPENAEGWSKVLDIFGGGATKLSIRTPNIDARVLAHDSGWWGAPAGMIIGTHTAHPLSFATNKVSRLTIDSAGNVGIGTIAPGAHLQVDQGCASGDCIVTMIGPKWNNGVSYNTGNQRLGIFAWSGYGGLSLAQHNVGGYLIQGGVGGSVLTFSAGYNGAGGEKMRIDGNGNVGIGTTDPVNKLHISGLTDGQGITIDEPDWTKKVRIFFREGGNNAYGGIVGYDAGPDVLYLNTLQNSVEKQGIAIARVTGNVGIGTTSPTEKLVVDGNLSISNGGLKGATFYSVSDAQSSTTSTSYQTKVSLTLPSAGTYIIIASCEVTGSSTSASYFPYVSLVDLTNGVTLGGELRPSVHTANTYANTQSWVVPYTISGSATIAIQYHSYSSSYTAYIRNARIFALRVA